MEGWGYVGDYMVPYHELLALLRFMVLRKRDVQILLLYFSSFRC